MYCTLDDIIADIGYDDLQQITDDHKTGVVDEGIVQRKIEEVDNYINSYIREHYSLPITSPGGLSVLKKIAVSLVVCELYQRRLGLDYPETLSRRKQDAVADLGKIQKGIINLQENTTNVEKKYLVSKRNRIFRSELY